MTAVPDDTVGWRDLERLNSHRTSMPTNEEVSRRRGQVAAARGRQPLVDAVLLAALELIPSTEALLRKVEEIERRSWQARYARRT